ncbi:hypothetical protein PsalMR5_04894 (plasmid) [Piscirickettsia salmonis]|uniref:DUF6829 domain-containing protein n=1 Tax=Piscirickettsia salmonis TaxID=1238 RepID=UPI0012BA8D9B|nr:hypothetical protein [Piscirickettsia salmonis]QGP57374.1 hypothetical protein PsalSR1_04863 [Piscirickettsia salmonis]QGP66969.1 hypothetical protein PsalMR5_04894 [Piscirickettsia salmonis]
MAFDKDFFIAQFEKYPELLTFLSPDVDATADYNPEQMSPWMLALYEAAGEYLPIAQGSDFPTPIKGLLKQSQPDKRSFELERTMLCLMSYHSVVLNDYSFFEKSPVMFGKPITHDQFNNLCELLSISEIKGMVELELVLGDLGKIRPLRQHICKIEGIEAQDPDQFIEALLQKGQDVCAKYLPTTSNLSAGDFSELIKINTGFHYGHFAHAESTERALAKLKIVIEERGLKYLSLNMLVQCLDVAGASAHAGGKILLNNIIAATYLNRIFPTLQRLQGETPEAIYLSSPSVI